MIRIWWWHWHLVQLESLNCGNLFQFCDVANPPRWVTRTEVQIKLEGIKSWKGKVSAFQLFLKDSTLCLHLLVAFRGENPILGIRTIGDQLPIWPEHQDIKIFTRNLVIITSSHSRIFSCLHLNHLSTLPAMAKRPRVAAHGEMWIMLMHNTSSYFSPAYKLIFILFHTSFSLFCIYIVWIDDSWILICATRLYWVPPEATELEDWTRPPQQTEEHWTDLGCWEE